MNINVNINSIDAYKEVLSVLENGYIAGLISGDFAKIRTSFHQDAIMYGLSGEKVSGGSIDNLVAYIEKYGPSKNMKFHLDVLHMTTTMAIVRIELENAADGGNYTDYHSFIKTDGKWLIIAKLFHLYD